MVSRRQLSKLPPVRCFVRILIKNVKRDFIDKLCGGWLSLKDVHSESCELYSLSVENSRVLKGIRVDTAVRIL